MCARGCPPSWAVVARFELAAIHPEHAALDRSYFMKPGDHVKIIGRDGFYVLLKEVQGTATLRSGSARSPDEPTLAIPINQVVSLEPTK